jgi:glycosyl transferase family 87
VLSAARIRVVSVAVLVFAGALLIASFAAAGTDNTAFGRPLGADYAEFYLAGRTLNRHQPDRLYDQPAQDVAYHRLVPGSSRSSSLPYLYPPVVALLFRPLAQLSYRWSFAGWLAISTALYAAGLLALRPLLPISRDDWLTAVLLALSFEPFVFETLQGGQLSSVAFAAVALALLAERRGHPAAAGAALGLCLYKPTLLIFIIPMLVVGRRWRSLAGLAVTGAGATALSVVAVGWRVARSYPRVLIDFSKATTGTASFHIPLWKYVDLNSFLRSLAGGPSAVTGAIVAGSAVAVGAVLWRPWWRWDQLSEQDRLSVWAATITVTVVVNVYVAIYDALLIGLSLLVTASVLLRDRPGGRPGPRLPAEFVAPAAAVFGLVWVSQPLAKATSFQVLTLALCWLAAYQVIRSPRSSEPRGVPGAAKATH